MRKENITMTNHTLNKKDLGKVTLTSLKKTDLERKRSKRFIISISLILIAISMNKTEVICSK
jgi:hypothetical protein